MWILGLKRLSGEWLQNKFFSLFFGRYASNSDFLTTDDLLLFLEAEQGVCNNMNSFLCLNHIVKIADWL